MTGREENGRIGRVALVYPEVKLGLSGCNPPYALLCLATSLIRNHVDSRVFDIDAYGGKLPRLLDALALYSPDVIGMPVFYRSFGVIQTILRAMHQRGVRGTVVLGGPEVAADAEHILDLYPSVRFCLSGEADLSLAEFVRRLLQGGDVYDIPGLTYRDGAAVHKNSPQLIDDLTILPVPDHTLLQESYARKVYWRMGDRGATAIIVSSRGCPYRCSFCFKVVSRQDTETRRAFMMRSPHWPPWE